MSHALFLPCFVQKENESVDQRTDEVLYDPSHQGENHTLDQSLPMCAHNVPTSLLICLENVILPILPPKTLLYFFKRVSIPHQLSV